MSRDHPPTDFSDSDEDRYGASVAAWQRVHGKPPEVAQPASYGRLGPRLEPAQFPGRETLATMSLRE
jgi:hypothetical protein